MYRARYISLWPLAMTIRSGSRKKAKNNHSYLTHRVTCIAHKSGTKNMVLRAHTPMSIWRLITTYSLARARDRSHPPTTHKRSLLTNANGYERERTSRTQTKSVHGADTNTTESYVDIFAACQPSQPHSVVIATICIEAEFIARSHTLLLHPMCGAPCGCHWHRWLSFVRCACACVCLHDGARCVWSCSSSRIRSQTELDTCTFAHTTRTSTNTHIHDRGPAMKSTNTNHGPNKHGTHTFRAHIANRVEANERIERQNMGDR